MGVCVVESLVYQIAHQPMIGELAPAFSLLDVRGKLHSLADQRGKFVVIHFGTSW